MNPVERVRVYLKQQQDNRVVAAGLAGGQVVNAGTLRILAPESTVEQRDAPREPAKMRLGMLPKIESVVHCRR